MSRARNFDESQIPETRRGFLTETTNMQCSYLTRYAIRINWLGWFGVPQVQLQAKFETQDFHGSQIPVT